MTSQKTHSSLLPGTIISVALKNHDDFHYGIVADKMDEYNLPQVIAFSHDLGRIQTHSWLGFTNGQQVNVYNSDSDANQVLEKARSKLNQEWSKGPHECKEFVKWANNGTKFLDTVVSVAAIAVIAGVFLLLIDAVVKRVSK